MKSKTDNIELTRTVDLKKVYAGEYLATVTVDGMWMRTIRKAYITKCDNALRSYWGYYNFTVEEDGNVVELPLAVSDGIIYGRLYKELFGLGRPDGTREKVLNAFVDQVTILHCDLCFSLKRSSRR